MPEPVEFPDEWLAVLRPRRSGRRGWGYQFDVELFHAVNAARGAHATEIGDTLAHPASDPRLVALARSGAATVEAAAAQLALETHFLWQQSFTVLAEERVQQLGLVDAAAACVESFASTVVYPHQFVPGDQREWHPGMVLTTTSAARNRGIEVPSYFNDELFDHLRRLLSRADDATWQAAVARLEPYRERSWRQRLATTYLLPDRRDWVDADFAEWPPDRAHWERVNLLDSVHRPDQTAGLVTSDLATMVTVVDALGHDAIPLLLRSLDWNIEIGPRSTILGVLARLDPPTVLAALLRRMRLTDIPAAFETMAAQHPEAALSVLAGATDDPYAGTLLARHVRRFPDLPGVAAHRRSAVPDASPAGLTDPPKAVARPPQTIAVPDAGVRLQWRDGERDEWNWDRWPTFEATHYDSEIGSTRFFLGGSEAAVRPRLADWPAEKFSFYLENPRLLVAKYELDAYRPVLRLARAKPVVGAPLLSPFVSADVAELMAKWLVGSRQFGALAREWFDRHGESAAALLVPPALGRPDAAGRVAVQALRLLDRDVVRTAADRLGCGEAVVDLLAVPPRPLKLPTVPKWVDVDALPRVLTRDRTHGLDARATRLLCRLVAASRTDEPHPWLDDACANLDPAGLAVFAWHLYCTWHIEGRPSKDAWALDALGLFGDDVVADRLAPLVRQWPSDGAAQRAKRGAEALAAMPGPAALQHLSTLARDAKSTPLRAHCTQLLDGVASERGLLPEQLDDLLAPDGGLNGDVEFRGVTYRPTIGASLDLVLQDPSGALHTTLPKPLDDAEKTITAAWTKRRRAARKDIVSQVRRLEQAMVDQRAWTRAEFETSIVAHPLLGALARRLVWTLDDQPVVLDELGDLVGPDRGLMARGEWVRLAHPATGDLTGWAAWRHRSATAQPFEQLDREVCDGDPSAHWNSVVTAASLHGLTGRGWHWGPSGRAAIRAELFRPLASGASVLLRIDPGVSAVEDASTQPDQTIVELTLHTHEHDDVAVFADLPRVTRSELVRELRSLGPASG